MQLLFPERWTLENDALKRIYIFQSFLEAIEFIDAVAPICESLGHHPEWTNIYNRIEISLATHDSGNTVTEKDILLAKSMEDIFLQFSSTLSPDSRSPGVSAR